MSLFRSNRGRIRWGWRLGLFLLVLAAVIVVGGFALDLLPLRLQAATGMTVGAGVSVVAALLASWFMAEKVEGMPTAALGLPLDRILPRDLARGFLLGAGLIAAAVAVMAAAGWVRWTAEPGGFATGAFLGSLARTSLFLLLAGFMEELVFRGYPFQVTAEGLGVGWALGLSSLVFAAAHAWNPGLGADVFERLSPERLLPLANIALAGLVLGLAYWRTYSLWYATGVHVGWNWTMGFAADLPVSGLEPGTVGYGLFETPGFDAVMEGPALWTGGAFGPEGGLVVTLVSLAGVAWLAGTGRLSPALRVRALGPLLDRGRGARGRPAVDADGGAGERRAAGAERGRGAGVLRPRGEKEAPPPAAPESDVLEARDAP